MTSKIFSFYLRINDHEGQQKFPDLQTLTNIGEDSKFTIDTMPVYSW
jgi:hypothetical protein